MKNDSFAALNFLSFYSGESTAQAFPWLASLGLLDETVIATQLHEGETLTQHNTTEALVLGGALLGAMAFFIWMSRRYRD